MINLKKESLLDAIMELDNNFNIIDCNREFLRFFNTVDHNISFISFLAKSDIIQLKTFVDRLNNDTKTKSLVLTANIRNEEVLILLTVIEIKENSIIYSIENVDYAKEFTCDIVTTNKEYEILLSSFDYEFFIYDYKKGELELKNTKNLQPLYVTFLDNLNAFLESRYDVDLRSDFTIDAIEKMKSDIINRSGGKRYSLLLKSKRYIVLTGYLIENFDDSRYLVTINMSNSLKESKSNYKETHDGLTELLNKETIVDICRQRIDVLQLESSVIVIDIDKFKEFNDNFGHKYGDEVLVNVSKAIKTAVSQYGEVGRYGGDEFLCILKTTDEEVVRNVCRNIRLGVQWCMPVDNPDNVVTCSMGITRYPSNGDSFDKLFDIADKCLYIAKNKGRNCYIIYLPYTHDKQFTQIEEKSESVLSGKTYKENAKIEGEIIDLIYNKCSNEGVLLKLKDYINISTIVLFDKNMNKIISLGNDKSIRDKMVKEPDYFKYNNKYDYFIADNTNILDTLDKERYNIYMANKIGSVLEILIRDEDGNKLGLLCLEQDKPSKTFDKSKVPFILFVANKIIRNL